jgi:hypothetical protein
MSQRLSVSKGFAIRAVIASACLAAVVFACVLSAIPQLHEEIHGVSGGANHECAVTLFSSGNCQHTPNPTISLAPPAPPASFVLALASFQLVSAHLEFSVLEHAPPSVS